MNIVDPFLFLICGMLLCVIVWLIHQAKQERIMLMEQAKLDKDKLINALVSKNPEQFRDLNLADKVEPIKPQPPQPPDLVPFDSLTDDEFEKHIQSQSEEE